MNYNEVYISNMNNNLSGRYITLDKIEPILNHLNTNNQLEIIGYSVLQKPIYSYTIGTGNIKILMWSQMHGNEGTTTKAIFDFLNVLHSESELSKKFLENITFCIIPMLNPDGAELYTRENANNIDLNRDFKELSEPESNILMKVFNAFHPNFCYNMHDQRTIHGIAEYKLPATVSFLAPSFNVACEFNQNRSEAAYIIGEIFKELSKFIPNQIGRFDDAYNENCAGDTFQRLGVPTMLFEAGHFQDDYSREKTRKYIFISILISFETILKNDYKSQEISNYMRIPQNSITFYDIICRNVKIIMDDKEKIVNFALQFDEVIGNNDINFVARLAKLNDLESDCGHLEFDANFSTLNNRNMSFPEIDEIVNFSIGENFNIINGRLSN